MNMIVPQMPESGPLAVILRRATATTTVVCLAMLLPALTMTPRMSGDEGIWSYVAWLWSQYGQPPYTGSVENKTPGILLLFTLSHRLFGTNVWCPRLMGVLAVGGATLLLYWIGRRLMNQVAGLASAIIFACAMSWNLMQGGTVAQTETFVVALNIASVASIVASEEAFKRRFYVMMLVAGLCLGMSVAFKQTALASALGIVMVGIGLRRSRPSQPGAPVGVLLAVAGAVFATVATTLPILAAGARLEDYWVAAWILPAYSGAHISKMQMVLNFVSTYWDPGSRIVICYPLLTLFIALWRPLASRGVPVTGLLVWLLLDFAAANASGLCRAHQLRQFVPQLALACGLALGYVLAGDDARDAEPAMQSRAALVALMILCLPVLDPRAGLQLVGKGKDDPVRSLGAWVRDNTKADDTVYVRSGVAGNILVAAQRRSPTRYFNTWFTPWYPGASEEARRDIVSRSPRVIIISSRGNVRESAPWLDQYLDVGYAIKKRHVVEDLRQGPHTYDVYVRRH